MGERVQDQCMRIAWQKQNSQTKPVLRFFFFSCLKFVHNLKTLSIVTICGFAKMQTNHSALLFACNVHSRLRSSSSSWFRYAVAFGSYIFFFYFRSVCVIDEIKSEIAFYIDAHNIEHSQWMMNTNTHIIEARRRSAATRVQHQAPTMTQKTWWRKNLRLRGARACFSDSCNTIGAVSAHQFHGYHDYAMRIIEEKKFLSLANRHELCECEFNHGAHGNLKRIDLVL